MSSSPSLPEQYGSFADYAASTIAVPRPASTSLDVARFHAFTGEISFSTDPAVRLYLDGGSVYHAERDGDPAISQVLRELGVAEAEQLERGMVRVGDVEHLGRLFDREPSIDRDAAIVVMETRTEAIVRELANRVTASVTVSAYRHHPSGIHRWFVVSTETPRSERPISAVAQVDRSVVDELPALESGTPTLEIEWSDPDPSGALPAPLPVAVEGGSGVEAEAALPPEQGSATQPLGAFQVVWPDGTADDAIVPGEPAAASTPLPPPSSPAADSPGLIAPDVAEAPVPLDALPNPERTNDSTTDRPPSFSIAPLQIDALPEPDAAIPDDVAAAVKRALKAIGSASTGGANPPELTVSPIALSELRVPTSTEPGPPDVPAIVDDGVQAPTDAVPTEAVPTDPGPDPVARVEEPVAAPPSLPAPEVASVSPGFAPPTPDMRAEVVYERAVAARGEADLSSDVAVGPDASDPSGQSGPGRASVVFVDDDTTPRPAAERRSALRRLIGSLRHKDD